MIAILKIIFKERRTSKKFKLNIIKKENRINCNEVKYLKFLNYKN